MDDRLNELFLTNTLKTLIRLVEENDFFLEMIEAHTHAEKTRMKCRASKVQVKVQILERGLNRRQLRITASVPARLSDGRACAHTVRTHTYTYTHTDKHTKLILYEPNVRMMLIGHFGIATSNLSKESRIR